jgi:hypothetical protein
MSGTHSALEPRLPIPNRTVKRGRADDSVHAYAKVGQCQTTPSKSPPKRGLFFILRDQGVYFPSWEITDTIADVSDRLLHA